MVPVPVQLRNSYLEPDPETRCRPSGRLVASSLSGRAQLALSPGRRPPRLVGSDPAPPATCFSLSLGVPWHLAWSSGVQAKVSLTQGSAGS